MTYLYFGVFDILCYAVATLVAIAIANRFCEQIEGHEQSAIAPATTGADDFNTTLRKTVSASTPTDDIVDVCTANDHQDGFSLMAAIDNWMTANGQDEKAAILGRIKDAQPTADAWHDITLTKLRRIGSRLGVKNAARMNKGDLIGALVADYVGIG